MSRSEGMSGSFKKRVEGNIFPLSTEKHDLEKALSEWAYSGESIDHEEPYEVCQMCEKEGLRYHFLIENDSAGTGLWVGSECIVRFKVGAVGEDGQVVSGEEAAALVLKDRAKMIEEARKKRVRSTLEAIIAVEKESWARDMVSSFLRSIGDKDGFSPKQMAVIAWRAAVHQVKHSTRDFKVTLRKQVHQTQVVEMADRKYAGLRPYLSAAQQERADQWRSAANPKVQAQPKNRTWTAERLPDDLSAAVQELFSDLEESF